MNVNFYQLLFPLQIIAIPFLTLPWHLMLILLHI